MGFDKLMFSRGLCSLAMCLLLTGCPLPGQNNSNDGDGDEDPPAPTVRDDAYPTSVSPLVVSGQQGVLANDTVTSPASVTAFDATSTQGGAVSVSGDGGFTYTPAAGFEGVDSFTYTVTDPGGSASATVQITVDLPALVTGPTAADDDYAASTSPLVVPAVTGVLANDTVSTPASVTAFDNTTSSGGSVVVSAGGGFTYVPPDGLNAVDTFTYTVTDAVGSATATVRITVTLPAPPAPTGVSAPPVNGSTGGDQIDGTADDDAFNGLAGDDTIAGGVGDDILNGEVEDNQGAVDTTGNDTLIGGSGGDRIAGDIAFNLLGSTVNRMGDDWIDGGADADTLLGDGVINNGSVVRAGDDTIHGGAANDQAYGDFQVVQVTGNVATCGNDIIFGGDGPDLLIGDIGTQNGTVGVMGNDTIHGGAGDDVLYGDTITSNGAVAAYGADTLEGGGGNDTLTGDTETAIVTGGADAFLVAIVAAFGDDRIRDYRGTDADVLRFRGVTDADADGTIARTDLDALLLFAFEDDGGQVRVRVTRRSDSSLLGTIRFDGIAFAGQATFEAAGINIQVAP